MINNKDSNVLNHIECNVIRCFVSVEGQSRIGGGRLEWSHWLGIRMVVRVKSMEKVMLNKDLTKVPALSSDQSLKSQKERKMLS